MGVRGRHPHLGKDLMYTGAITVAVMGIAALISAIGQG